MPPYRSWHFRILSLFCRVGKLWLSRPQKPDLGAKILGFRAAGGLLGVSGLGCMGSGLNSQTDTQTGGDLVSVGLKTPFCEYTGVPGPRDSMPLLLLMLSSRRWETFLTNTTTTGRTKAGATARTRTKTRDLARWAMPTTTIPGPAAAAAATPPTAAAAAASSLPSSSHARQKEVL